MLAENIEFDSSLTEEARDARSRGIGGSDVAAVLGISKWKTPVDLWAEKTGFKAPEPIKNPEAAHFGVLLEDIVAREFMRRTGKTVHRKRGTLVHARHPFMLANIDRRVVGERAGLECKTNTAFGAHEWGETGSDDLPLYYITQCVHYLEVLDYERWYLAVLIGGNDFRWYVIERRPQIAAPLIEREAMFWQSVLAKEPPDPQIFRDVTTLYPRDSGKPVVATDAIFAALGDYAQLGADVKLLESRRAALKLEIGAFMKDKSLLIDRAGAKLARFKAHKTTHVDIERLKAERPDIYAEYVKEIDVRPFVACV